MKEEETCARAQRLVFSLPFGLHWFFHFMLAVGKEKPSPKEKTRSLARWAFFLFFFHAFPKESQQRKETHAGDEPQTLSPVP